MADKPSRPKHRVREYEKGGKIVRIIYLVAGKKESSNKQKAIPPFVEQGQANA